MTLIMLSERAHSRGSWTPNVASDAVEQVLHDRALGNAEKRSLLSSWASDANAVEDKPWLRRIPGRPEPVPVVTILAALRRLDDDDPPPRGGAVMRLPTRQRRDSEPHADWQHWMRNRETADPWRRRAERMSA